MRATVALLGTCGSLNGCISDGLLLGDQPNSDQKASVESGGNDEERDYPDAEDGSCSAWKFAYCDAISACSAFETREECELDLGWLVCQEDAPVSRCQHEIERALEDDDCDALPKDCTPEEIADRSMVIELCEEIHEALCEQRFFCGTEFSLESCMTTLSQVEPCDSFTSFVPTAVDCAEAYSVLACNEPMPEVCAGSLRR